MVQAANEEYITGGMALSLRGWRNISLAVYINMQVNKFTVVMTLQAVDVQGVAWSAHQDS